MHHFEDLVYRSTSFLIDALGQLKDKIVKELEINGSTVAVKNLQMVQLQKAITAIGMFSLFESILQTGLESKNGFSEAKKMLIKSGKAELYDRFDNFIAAINVLKHGKGRSYDSLVAKAPSLPFRVKLPDDVFFGEGDVSELSTLIEVNDKFVLDCAELIEKVSKEIRSLRSDYAL